MKEIRVVGTLEKESSSHHHRAGIIQFEDGARTRVLAIRASSWRNNVAVNEAELDRARSRGVNHVLVGFSDHQYLVPMGEFHALLVGYGNVRNPASGRYWLLDQRDLPEEHAVTKGHDIPEGPVGRPEISWQAFRFADKERMFEEVGQAIGLAKTFYNPSSHRIAKELGEKFDFVNIDLLNSVIHLGKKN